MRNGSKMAGIFFVICALLLLQSQASFAGDEIKVGASISLSGKMVREGTALKDGYTFWADWANAKGGVKVGDKKYKIKMVYYDDESNGQTCAKLVEKLITEDKVDIILGPYASSMAMPATTVSERHRYVMILPTNNSDKLYSRGYKYIFSQAPVASQEGWPIMDMFRSLPKPPKTIAILASNSTYSLLVANGLNSYCKKIGVNVVFFDKFPEETSDLSSVLSVIKTKNPDLFYGCGYFEHSALVTRQLKDQNFTPKAYVFAIGPQLPDFVKTLGKDANYALAPSYWTATMKYRDPAFTIDEYNTMFKKQFGHYPTYHAAQGTGAGRLLQRALEKAGSLQQDKIREALSKIELKDTLVGEVKFDEAGRNIWGKVGVLQIQDGKRVIVYPPKAAEAKLAYPAVPWNKR